MQQLCLELSAAIHSNFFVAATVGGYRKKLALYEAFDSYNEELVKAKAIELAINFRILDEQLSDSPSYVGLRGEVETAAIGRFTVGASRKGTTLDLREACNKLIHAMAYRFERARFDSQDYTTDAAIQFHNECREATIVVTGEQRGKPWECYIDLMVVAEQAYEVVDQWVCGEFKRV